MKSDGNPAAVRVIVDLMGACTTIKCESVADQSRNDLTGTQIAQLRIVHKSDSDRDTRIVHRHLNVISGLIGQKLPVFHHTAHH